MSKKIYTDSWGAKYERSVFGSVKGADGHNYKQVALSPVGSLFGGLFWIGVIVYSIITDPFTSAYVFMFFLSIVALIRGLFSIKKKYNATAPSNLMAFAVIWIFFYVYRHNDDLAASLYTFYTLSLVLSLGFLIAARMKWYAIFGIISLILDIACSVIYGSGVVGLVSSLALATLILLLPLLGLRRESESRAQYLFCMILICGLAIKEILYDGSIRGVYGSISTAYPLTIILGLRNLLFFLIPVFALLIFMYFIVKKKQPVWAGVCMAALMIAEVLLLKTRYRYFMADPYTILRLSACALTTLCMVWQSKRYVAPEPPSVKQDSMENKPETSSEEQPAD